MNKKALFILANGVEELEAIAPIDLLRRANVEVTLATNESQLEITGRNQIKLIADTFIDECLLNEYDLIVIPGGPGHVSLRKLHKISSFLVQHAAKGKIYAAICAAPVILKDAGLLEGRTYTAHYSMAEELPDILKDKAVVVDGPVITSRGAGTATIFGLTLVEQLCGKEVSDKISEDIHWEGLFR